MEEKHAEEKHTQFKAKCLKCNLHFVVYTEHPEKHSKKSLYCPECGQHSGNFATWAKVVAGPIYREVPGDAPPTDDMDLSGPKALKIKHITDTH